MPVYIPDTAPKYSADQLAQINSEKAAINKAASDKYNNYISNINAQKAAEQLKQSYADAYRFYYVTNDGKITSDPTGSISGNVPIGYYDAQRVQQGILKKQRELDYIAQGWTQVSPGNWVKSSVLTEPSGNKPKGQTQLTAGAQQYNRAQTPPSATPASTITSGVPAQWKAPSVPGTGQDDIFARGIGKKSGNLGGLMGGSSPYANPFGK